jgi:peptidoglycan lytic transglycosylase
MLGKPGVAGKAHSAEFRRTVTAATAVADSCARSFSGAHLGRHRGSMGQRKIPGDPHGGRPRRYGRLASMGVAVLGALALAQCASSDKLTSRLDPKYGVMTSPRVVELGEPVPKGGGTYRVGKPYVVGGRTYVPEEDISYRAEGIASWYGDDFHGRLTANGEVFDMDGISAAHPTLPMPSYVRVTNLANRHSLIVRVNDRGPYHGDRVIDVSRKAADLLGFHSNGVAHVQVEYVGRAPLEGSDDRLLTATLRNGQPAPPPESVRVAAARPFVPELRSGRAMRGAIPVPPDRPFSLGEAAPELRGTTDMTAVARPRAVESAALRAPAPQAPALQAAAPDRSVRMTPETSGYAPSRQNLFRADTPMSFMSGHDLY